MSKVLTILLLLMFSCDSSTEGNQFKQPIVKEISKTTNAPGIHGKSSTRPSSYKHLYTVKTSKPITDQDYVKWTLKGPNDQEISFPDNRFDDFAYIVFNKAEGYYKIKCQVRFDGSSGWDHTYYKNVQVYKNPR